MKECGKAKYQPLLVCFSGGSLISLVRRVGLYGEAAMVSWMLVMLFSFVNLLFTPKGFYWGREPSIAVWFHLPVGGQLNLLAPPLALLALAAVLLFPLSLKRFSEFTMEPGIWSNLLRAVLFLILASVLPPFQLFHANTNIVNGVPIAYGPTFNPALFTIGLVETWALPFVSALFAWRSFSLIASKVKVKWFSLAAWLLLASTSVPIESLGYSMEEPYPLLFYSIWLLLSFAVAALLLLGFHSARNLKE